MPENLFTRFWVSSQRETGNLEQIRKEANKQFELLERETCSQYDACPLAGLERLLLAEAEGTIGFIKI